MSDKIAHPSHYEGAYGVECMEAMRNALDRDDGLTGAEKYWMGCALKYLWRWPFKNGLEDLRKSRQCVDYLIAEVEAKCVPCDASREGNGYARRIRKALGVGDD